MCRPKAAGGLGLRKGDVANLALVAKLGWRISTQTDNYWVQIMRAKYLRNLSFFEIQRMAWGFFAWKGILQTRNLLATRLRWMVGNGRSIKF